MKPTKVKPKFGVCPKCGADTHRIGGRWVCKSCEYEERIERG